MYSRGNKNYCTVGCGKKFLAIAYCALFIVITSGCRKKVNEISHAAAEQLFHKSLTLLKAYTDSLNNATDSAHVERLARAFDSKINAINFEFPPDTDLRLTEEENDSLIKMADRMVESRRKRLYGFAVHNTDSVMTDTIHLPPILTQP